jgi:hypothetical protein
MREERPPRAVRTVEILETSYDLLAASPHIKLEFEAREIFGVL